LIEETAFSLKEANMRFYRESVLVVLTAVLLFSIPVTAQNGVANETAVSAADPTTKSDYGLQWGLERLPEFRKQAADMEFADKEAKTKLLDIYDKALALWKQIQITKEETAAFSNRIGNIPADLTRIKEQLSQTVDEVFPENAGTMPLADVQKEVAAAQTSYEEAKKNSTTLENEPKRRAERRVNIPVERAAAREQLAQMKEKQPAPGAEINVADMVFAGRVLQIAQIIALEAKIENLAEELKIYDTAGDLLTARRELASKILVQAEKRQKFWQVQLVEAQRRETEKLKEKAKETVKQAKYAHPVIQKVAQENAELVNIQAELIRQMEQANQYSKMIETDLAELETEFTDLKKEIDAAGGITGVMGVLLLSKRDELQDPAQNREQIKARLGKISSAKLNWSKYDKQWSELADTEAAAKLKFQEEKLTEEDPEYDESLKEAVKLLEDRRKDIRKISDYYEDLSTALARLDVRERKLVSSVSEYEAFIDENILWIRGSASITLADIVSTGAAVAWFVNPKPEHWIDLWRYLWGDFQGHIPIYTPIILLVFVLWLYRLSLANRLKDLAKCSGHVYSDKFIFTLKALVFSIIIIVPLPLLTGFFFWRLFQSPPKLTLAHLIGSGLKSVTILMILFPAFIRFFRKNGLSDHFNLPRESMDVFVRYLRLTFLILIPVIFIRRIFCDPAVEEVYRNSLGRIGFVAEMIVISLFFMTALRPSGAGVRPLLVDKKTGWTYKMRYMWYGALIILPVLFAVLDLLGYDYTAGQLYYKFVATVLLVFAIMFCKAILTRWLTLIQNRLVLRRKVGKKAEKAILSADTDPRPDQETLRPQPESEDDSEQQAVDISQQTLRLVRSVAVLAVFLGIWLIWKNVLPALSALENIRVWDTTDAQGATVIISLGNVIKAILIFIMMVVAARNAPGLMEIAILQRLPLDQGVRFAITSLSRYTLVIVGVVMTFGQIGIGWTKVQWLIAAMTVGLGFGLQEIFANFVSGLIILFEQPIRVGDAVTVGDVNGTVTKIKMRATTIRKWDQKELIVPNREFITGRLLNWSLSDTTLRMEFPVGVAYGSDIKKTEETLYRVARNQEGVIHDDPAPMVVFRSFGESSLEFELRIYIPNMDNYLKIWHETNCNIDSEFRKEGIEIAFPQRDLHIRSVKAPFPVQMDPRRDSTERS
jgi:potassium efflux system protein